MRDPRSVIAEALALPEPERAELARRLSASLDPVEDGDEAEDAWAATVAERVEALRAGAAKTQSADRVFPSARDD